MRARSASVSTSQSVASSTALRPSAAMRLRVSARTWRCSRPCRRTAPVAAPSRRSARSRRPRPGSARRRASSSACAASRRCSGVSAGQSVPITSVGPSRGDGASMRAPRSPSGCRLSTIATAQRVAEARCGRGRARTTASPGRCRPQRRSRRRARSAAPAAPPRHARRCAGMSRVLAKPGIGALARTAMLRFGSA